MENIFKDDEKYLRGTQNWAIRYYYYLSAGLNEFNSFRNIFLAILTVYVALKLSSYWWAVGMFIGSILVLTIVGYYTIHRISKVRDWLSVRFSSYFGMKSINYTEESFKLLTEIRDSLKNKDVTNALSITASKIDASTITKYKKAQELAKQNDIDKAKEADEKQAKKQEDLKKHNNETEPDTNQEGEDDSEESEA